MLKDKETSLREPGGRGGICANRRHEWTHMRGCHTGTQVVTQAVRLGGQQGADAKGPSL